MKLEETQNITHVVDQLHPHLTFHVPNGLTLIVGENSEGDWVCHNVLLDVTGYGKTREESLVQFKKSFSSCWHGLSKGWSLTLEAQQLSRKIKSIGVQVVPTICDTTDDHDSQTVQNNP